MTSSTDRNRDRPPQPRRGGGNDEEDSKESNKAGEKGEKGFRRKPEEENERGGGGGSGGEGGSGARFEKQTGARNFGGGGVGTPWARPIDDNRREGG